MRRSTTTSAVTLAPLALHFGFSLGRNSAEGHSPAFLVDAGDPSCHHITHLDCFVEVFHEPVGHFADVDQTTAIGGQLDEHTEGHHTHDHADDLVAWMQ
jgi:hypothetical protein